ncbi:hypothetical protein A3A40_01885 [Candidatus Kaiserbacteria bacterium RIFCSPLOWO2_01_FULL_54_20]|uniref:Uncharacterized protein n=1 Tax=Candidatus Kaiserbacteria bacterium RIFCSPLOWO2_01_FULL_54_20 TaxID=1798513 RepID=A0A1F6EIJ1_9BACT|nr:MAG: hypothetical protein A3A40_01885 [Candidatus Kaiserbacteria bacterium RIFCSPLOWO2_01_FULL_54_20]
MAKKEPTNQDILEGMNKRFNMVFTELKKNDSRFDLTFRQLTSLHKGVEEIREQQKADGEVLDEVKETLEAVAKAVDIDAVTIINHETRIARLEKSRVR